MIKRDVILNVRKTLIKAEDEFEVVRQTLYAADELMRELAENDLITREELKSFARKSDQIILTALDGIDDLIRSI